MMKTTDEALAYLNTIEVEHWTWAQKVLEPWLGSALTPDARTETLGNLRALWRGGLQAAREHNDLAATRCRVKISALAWLIDDQEALALCRDESLHDRYGVPLLAALAKLLGVELPTYDLTLQNLARGEPCSMVCRRGCN